LIAIEMTWTIDDSSMPMYLRATIEGAPTIEDYLALWNAIVAHDDWRPGMSVLVDATRREPFGSQALTIVDELAKFFAQNSSKLGRSCIASFVSEIESYKFSRVFEYSAHLRGSSVVLRTFPDEESAMRWLAYVKAAHG
jgi:hypothetical protein